MKTFYVKIELGEFSGSYNVYVVIVESEDEILDAIIEAENNISSGISERSLKNYFDNKCTLILELPNGASLIATN